MTSTDTPPAPADREMTVSVVGGAVCIEIDDCTDDAKVITKTHKATIMVPLDELTNALAFLAVSDRNDCVRPELPFTKANAKAFMQHHPMMQLAPFVVPTTETQEIPND